MLALQMNTLASKLIAIRRRFRGKAPYYGFYSNVAREVGTWPSHVRRVFFGGTTSDRVARAIIAAVESWDESRKGRRAA
jgi:hypothetical protein